MGYDVVPRTTTTDLGAASHVRGAGHRDRLRAWLSRAWSSKVAALGLTVLIAGGCVVFPDGSFTTKDPIAGEPSLAWNDPDDGLTDSPIDLADVGYHEAEHFIGGSATAYDKVEPGSWLPDGRWQAQPATGQGFTTRILVRRPADPDAFNGVVVVEWLNVTTGRDLDGLFRPTHTELLEEGYVWVGVSAQKAGVDDLKQRDPGRYGALQHPGDDYAYDIFTRAGRIVSDPASPVLGGLHPEVVLASGTSQSASGLLTYINAVHPLVAVYDGFQLQSHLGGAMAVRQGASMPASPIVRTDIDVPVLDVQSETDIVFFRTHRNRQDDHPHFRLWELAGSSHAGEYGRSLTWPPNPTAPGDPCTERINSAPMFAAGQGGDGSSGAVGHDRGCPAVRASRRADRSSGCRPPGARPARQRPGGHPVPPRRGADRPGRRLAERGAARQPEPGVLLFAGWSNPPLVRRPTRRSVPDVGLVRRTVRGGRQPSGGRGVPPPRRRRRAQGRGRCVATG